MTDTPPIAKGPEYEVRADTRSVIRVYDPPLPLEHDPKAGGGTKGLILGPEGYTFRDFPAFKIDFANDGTMVLYGMKYLGRKTDLQSGKVYDESKQVILAVVDTDGHLRAETVEISADEPVEGLN